MDNINFNGKTRTLGEAQGYRALHIKDINLVDEKGNQFPAMISVWKPTEAELEVLMNGGFVMLTVLGNSHPPVMLDTLRNE